jgi:hypothetical protein
MPTSTPLMTTTTATRQGDGRTNQDHIVVTDNAVAVLDGATSWLPQDPDRDGGWYARTLGAQLASILTGSLHPLTEILSEAIATMRDRYHLAARTSPESTVTIARWTPGTLDVLVLSDSPAILYPPHGEPIVIRDDRLEPVGAAARQAYRDHLRAGHGYGPELRTLIARVQEAERRQRNRPDGYWIAEADPEAARHALTASYPTDNIDALVLLTDGASAAVDDYGHPATWQQVRQAIEANGPDAFLADVHGLEDTDPNGERWPRSKCHDDKALAYIVRGGGAQGTR